VKDKCISWTKLFEMIFQKQSTKFYKSVYLSNKDLNFYLTQKVNNCLIVTFLTANGN